MRTRHLLHILVLAALLVSGQVTGASAQATRIVTTNANSGPGSLRDAVAGAAAGDTIRFDMSRVVSPIALSTGQIVLNKDLAIEGPGPNLLTVQNTAPMASTSRVFRVEVGVAATISGLTISGGNVPNGQRGGGILNFGTLTVSSATISGNAARLGGGGIANVGGILTVTYSTLSNNSVFSGDGGGLLTFRNGTVLPATIVTHTTISGNSTTPGGDGFGGGIWHFDGPLTVVNSTIAGNSADGGGGISSAAPLTLINSTLADNVAVGSGAGLFVNNLTTLRNTIIANNVGASVGGNCERLANATVDAQYSLIEDGLGCVNATNISNLTGDPRLGPLQDNGGPTLTHALLQDSPAIDAGSDMLATDAGLTTDQRGAGVIRFVGARVDIGAFEYDPAPKFIPAAPLTLERGTVGGASVRVGTAVTGGSTAPLVSVGQVAGGTANGLLFLNAVVGSGGPVTATTPPVSCIDTSGTVRFAVSDVFGHTGEGDLQVNVVPSTVGACVCPVGSVGDGTTCTCLAGFFKPAGATACRPADPGHYVPEAGATEQLSCDAGRYQPDAGAETCLSADPGHFVAMLAAIAQVPCEPGKYQPDADAESCIPASSGFYVPAAAATAQLACPVGTTSAVGATACHPIPPAFPANGVLDTFNRTSVGSRWNVTSILPNYKIAGNRLDVVVGGPTLWQPTVFGPSQEAFVTLAVVDTRSPSQGVLLKVQTGSVPNAGAISVVYDALAQQVRVSTLRTTVPVWQPYASVAATFVHGDQLGARALAKGTVEVYRNGTRLATVTLSASDQAFFNARGGRIGLWALAAPGAFFDDFGGGTLVP